MKLRLADYIAQKLVENGITQNFSVTGGGAMHLNDAFGHQPGMHTLYQHHEQACAMAAESYARIYNRPALLCVTSGPGGTNAITGVLGAWLDSIPMLVISGQVRYDNTARWAMEQNGVELRAMGDQEFDIVKSVSCMCKYAEMLTDPYRVRYAVEKALYLSQTGRPGPCWLDIPVDIQGMKIETDELTGFDPENYENGGDGWGDQAASAGQDSTDAGMHDLKDTAALSHRVPEDSARAEQRTKVPAFTAPELLDTILEKIRSSERPVFYTGNGIRIAGAEALFLDVAHRLNIPVVVGWNGPDVIPTGDPLYAGRPGGRGDRPGNLTVQNADLILSIGSRLNIRQVGYNFKTWARDAYVIVNDIDPEELKKPSVHADLRILQDARVLLRELRDRLEAEGFTADHPLFQGGTGIAREGLEEICHTDGARELVKQHNSGKKLSWLETTRFYVENYPTVLPEHFTPSDRGANVYALIDLLSRKLSEGQITVVGNGSPCVAGGQAYWIKNGTRFISQDGVASMGYGLPAAIGASAAVHGPDGHDYATRESAAERHNAENRDPYWAGREEIYPDYEKHDIILLTGDGSIQMNLQELQTIIHHQMPIKIFLINNGGYHSIRQTQTNLFGNHPMVGVGVDSGLEEGRPDLSFPDMEKLAAAYGYPYVRVTSNADLPEGIDQTLAMEGPVICEVFVTMDQQFLPKSSAKRLPDGSLVSPPLEDMSPFLPEEEMNKVMIVDRI